MKCEICNKETKNFKAEKYHYTLSGLSNVFLKNIEVEKCNNCDVEIPLIPRILLLHKTIARAIISKKSLLLGEEIRFLRKNLRIKAQDWAKFLRKDVATISRAEKDGNFLNKDLDLLIRLLYVRLWEEKNEDVFSEKIAESLLITDNKEQSILINVENIEEFSYFEPLEYWDDIVFVARFEETTDYCKKTAVLEEEVFTSSSPFMIGDFYAKNNEFATTH
jgi:putative zinc finger/helix-turn-helix YgiT family protein